MNIPSIIVLVLFLVLVCLITIFMYHKGPNCGCSCDRCASNCKHKLLLCLITVSMGAMAQTTNPNSRLIFQMKDGSAMRLAVDRIKDMQPIKMDEAQKPTADYASWYLTTVDNKAALLPISALERIVYIKGEPTDGALGAIWYEIQRKWNQHSEVVMLNSINNYNDGKGVITSQYDNNWCGQREMYPVAFLATGDIGYDINFRVVGMESRTVYSDINGFVIWLPQSAEGNQWGQSCWAFPMPPETVLIEAEAIENTDYDQFPWLGDYYGHPVQLTDDFIYRGTNPSLTRLSLKGNKSYIFSSSAGDFITSNMRYEYTNDAFHYTQDETGDLSWRGDQDYYGLAGQWLNDSLIYLRATNINVDKPENVHRFFMLKNGEALNFKATVGAKDNWSGRSTQYLAELQYGGHTYYYYMDNYGAAIREAQVEFKTGSTIADSCDAIITYMRGDTEERFGYRTKDGSNPEFYTLEQEQEKPETAEWTGCNLFQNENALGRYSGVESNKHHIYVRMDQNVNGSTNKGYCSIRIDMFKGYGTYDNYFISSGGNYIYSPKNSTITVQQVLVGVNGGGQTERRDLVFKVSDDLKTLTFDPEACGETLWGSRTETYINTGDLNPLVASE